MPELAEVETVRNTLKKSLIGKKILSINILYPKMIENDLEYFKECLINNEILDIERKGKYLIFKLNKYYLISHLRMEGKYFIKDKIDPILKHEHIIFEFNDFSLRYHDTRKFGRMHLIKYDELSSYFSNLGPDANKCDDSSYLYEKLHKSSLPIKTLLLDQSIISGLGNIYADEVLYESKISPLKKGKDITLDNCNDILKKSKEILDMAIKYKGTTIRSYTSSLNVKGEYQKYLKVHRKCVCKCTNKITKIKIGGRSTYYCDNCQKL